MKKKSKNENRDVQKTTNMGMLRHLKMRKFPEIFGLWFRAPPRLKILTTFPLDNSGIGFIFVLVLRGYSAFCTPECYSCRTLSFTFVHRTFRKNLHPAENREV